MSIITNNTWQINDNKGDQNVNTCCFQAAIVSPWKTITWKKVSNNKIVSVKDNYEFINENVGTCIYIHTCSYMCTV
jgi:signal transduction histidine kinase